MEFPVVLCIVAYIVLALVAFWALFSEKRHAAELKRKNQALISERKTLRERLEEIRQENDELKMSTVCLEPCDDTATNQEMATAQQEEKTRRIAIGAEFEKQVSACLQKEFSAWLTSGEAKLLHNVVLRTECDPKGNRNPMWTQIDLLLLHTSGVYFIECKRWAGLIIGKSGWEKWIQVKCGFDDTNHHAPLFANGMPAQYFNSPSEQVDHQRATLGQFLKELHARDKSLDFVEIPWKKGKRMIVMDRLGGDTSSVDIGNSRKDNDYLWFGYVGDLADTIRGYAQQLPDGIAQIRLDRLYQQLLPYSDEMSEATVL